MTWPGVAKYYNNTFNICENLDKNYKWYARQAVVSKLMHPTKKVSKLSVFYTENMYKHEKRGDQVAGIWVEQQEAD